MSRLHSLMGPLLFLFFSPTGGQFLFQAPNRYIFHGAEVYSDSDDETSSSCGSDSDGSECSHEGVEECSDPEEAARLPSEETCHRDALALNSADQAAPSAQTDSTLEKTDRTAPL